MTVWEHKASPVSVEVCAGIGTPANANVLRVQGSVCLIDRNNSTGTTSTPVHVHSQSLPS